MKRFVMGTSVVRTSLACHRIELAEHFFSGKEVAWKTNPALVHRIDKSDESSRQVALVVIHPRHVGNNKRIVMPHQFEIIRRTGSRSDQLIKGEQRGRPASLGDLDLAAPDLLDIRVRRVVDRVAQEVKPLAGVLVGCFT